MRRSARRAGLVAALAAAAVTTVLAAGAPADAAQGHAPFTFAVIGDIPYGDAQIARFPRVVDQINADPAVSLVDHLGDIKSGSSRCDTTYFQAIRAQFDRFEDPLVYTPGDNEWTDCHRPNNGGYDPLGRLATIRSTFFDQPGRTLGRRSVGVATQAATGYPENVRYSRAGVAFAAVHVVGSNNSLVPWTGQTGPTPAQLAEEQGRTRADLDLIDATFDAAQAEGDKAVVLLTQADMFDVTVPRPAYADYSAFTPLVQKIIDRSAAFHGPVYLFNGDSHVYNADQPLAPGSPWLSFYGVHGSAANLSRITVDGSTGVNDYLRVSVRPSTDAVLSWEKVPFTP